MKKLLSTLTILLFLIGCSPRPIIEGPVKFVIYEPEPGDVRTVHVDKAPSDFVKDSNYKLSDLWDCDPYVRLYPDYVEIVYHFKKKDNTQDVFTHVIPASRLHFLRWLNRK